MNKVSPFCLVKTQKAPRTLFPTCWHIHILIAFFPPCARWHCCYHFVHQTSNRHDDITMSLHRPRSLQVGFVALKAASLQRAPCRTQATPRRPHSGANPSAGRFRCVCDALHRVHVSEECAEKRAYIDHHGRKWCNSSRWERENEGPGWQVRRRQSYLHLMYYDIQQKLDFIDLLWIIIPLVHFCGSCSFIINHVGAVFCHIWEWGVYMNPILATFRTVYPPSLAHSLTQASLEAYIV